MQCETIDYKNKFVQICLECCHQFYFTLDFVCRIDAFLFDYLCSKKKSWSQVIFGVQ